MADDVRLLDAGDGRRLDRLGSLVVDRPAGAATGARRAPAMWREVDLRFDPGTGWRSLRGRPDPAPPWDVRLAGLTLELRPTASGGVGLYPEHAANLEWLAACAARRGNLDVLNLFAHTGLTTLSLARGGAWVAHVDAARSAVAWARRNAELSGLAERHVRWLVDDARAFTEREARRGHTYDGIVLDPPSSGTARGGAAGGRRRWTLRDDLESLLEACAAAANPGAFVLLTVHTTGVEPDDLVDAIGRIFRGPEPQLLPLRLDAESGARLDLGWAVRLDPLDAAP